MNTELPVAVVLSGAAAGVVHPAIFADNAADAVRYHPVMYPGWVRYIADDFHMHGMLDDLADTVEKLVPYGPIRIVGVSLGGHIGYALALMLQKRGRTVGGLCALDSFMVTHAGPREGWGGRAFSRGLSLVRDRRHRDFVLFLRELFWRALLRAGGDRVPRMLSRRYQDGRLPAILRVDPKFEEELSMRLLIRHSAPWVAALDAHPQTLHAPAVLIRTPETAGDDEAWTRRCPELRVVSLPGDHYTMFDVHNLHRLRAAFLDATRDWRSGDALQGI